MGTVLSDDICLGHVGTLEHREHLYQGAIEENAGDVGV